tara:strand:+ start:4854 stop:5174 length:321 start_codon:yes stop_codon:yes gene_type:complete
MTESVKSAKALGFLSVELLLSVAATIALVSVSWGSLSTEQVAQSVEVKGLRDKQQQVIKAVEGIRVSLATVEANQKNQADSAKQAQLERRRIEDKLDTITQRLLSN